MDLNDKRDFYNGFGDGLARAFEFAVTPAIFGFLGYLVDRAVGTLPVFTLIFALVCIVGMFLKTMYTYQAMMQAHDAKSPWAKVPLTSAAAAAPASAVATATDLAPRQGAER